MIHRNFRQQPKLGNNIDPAYELQAETAGSVLLYDASGDPLVLGPGSDGQVLYTRGADAVSTYGWMVETLDEGSDATEYSVGSTYTALFDMELSAGPAAGTAYEFLHMQAELWTTGNFDNLGVAMGNATVRNAFEPRRAGIDLLHSDRSAGTTFYSDSTTHFFLANTRALPATGSANDVWIWGRCSAGTSSGIGRFKDFYWHHYVLHPNP